MHPIILDATGYTLLLASFITLVILLREGCKYRKTSPFYILSTSDVFSTVLTAIVLFLSRMETSVTLDYNWQNDTSDMPNHTWTIEDDEGKQFLFSRIREFHGTADSNVTLTCDMTDVLMHYGMLLAPLTNAFVSLLTFIVQCNLNAMCVKQKCADIIASSTSDTRSESESADITNKKRKILEEEQKSTSQQRSDINVKSSVTQRIMKAVKFQTLKEDDKKPVGILIMSHWLIPLLVVATLYFAEYNDMNTARRTDDTECVFESNFPVNFHVLSDIKHNLKTTDSNTHITQLGNNYFDDEELSNKSNSTDINQIVSRVQNIVRIVLSIHNSTENTGIANSFDSSRMQNITEYVATSNTGHIEDNTNTDGLIQGIHHTVMQQTNIHTYQNPNASLFHHLLKNASEELDVTTIGSLNKVTQTPVQDKDDNYQENTEKYFAEGNTTRGTINMSIVHDVPTLLNNQIYADIIKRIQAANALATIKNHRNHSVKNGHYNKKQPKRDNFIEYIATVHRKIKPNSIEDLFFHNDDNFNHNVNKEMYMTNECLLSTKFLKLHLFILSIAIYFLPILLCCILQMRGKHMCENTLAILNAKAGLISNLLCSNVNSNKHDNEITVNEPHSDSFSKSDKRRICHQDLKKDFDTLETRDHSNTTDVEVASKHNENMEIPNKNIISEIDSVAKIFRIIKMSLILCIIFWTPILLGTLLRVFSCIFAPQWLTDITFLGAISFGIIRNIFNIKIIKTQEFCNDTVKENRIYPIK